MVFSVILPLYNKAPYVAKAIGSVLSQTFTNYELIIMDDGSKDDSYNVASKAIDELTNCHLHRQQNGGASMARNNAVALSQGDYLCFLDADDWWNPDFLKEMSRLIDDYPEAGIYGTGYTIVNEMKKKTRVASIGVEQGFERGYINYCQVYANGMYMPLWTGAVCIPRSVFDEMNGFKEQLKLGEDFDLWIRIALKYKVAFLNKPLSNYNQDSAPEWRAVGHLQEPQSHMLWNLGYLEKEERINADYKQLIDNLRTTALFPYYLSKQFREDARRELDKVDWTKQSEKTKALYRLPIPLLVSRQLFLKVGSMLKQWIIQHV
jgi:glycosyltransferase involved in cell wall biosynthesis